MAFFKSRSASAPAMPQSIELDGEKGPISVRLKPNPRAKRLILRLDPKTGAPVATVPPGLKDRQLKSFLQSHIGWIEERQEKRPQATAFENGAVIPVRGIDHTLVHIDQKRGTVRQLQEGERYSLLVSGDESHMARRVTDWLKKQARQDLTAAVEHYAGKLEVTPSALRIKDTTSRWGSCSSKRVLSFSWRIIMAPPSVLDYLAAHEVAHLREMNHSPRYWAHVADICPDYEEAKHWLKINGHQLHSYGNN